MSDHRSVAGSQGRLEPQEVARQQRVRDGDGDRSARWPASIRSRPPSGIRVVAPSSERQDLDADRRRPASAAPRSSRGTTIDRPPRGDEHEHRQSLERHGLVAGQVAQVRPDADEQRIQAVGRGRGGRALEAFRVALGGDDRAGRDAHVGSLAIQAASVAGPSSNSFR